MSRTRESKRYCASGVASGSEDSSDNNLDQFRDLPQFLEKINQNIMNIDNKITNNNRENSSKSKGNKGNNSNQNQIKNNVMQECFDIKNLVKQSVEGLNDIFNTKMSKNSSVITNVNSSCRNMTGSGFEIIEEEPIISSIIKTHEIKKEKITNNINNSVPVNKKIKSSNIESNNNNKNQLENKKNSKDFKDFRQIKSKLKVEVISNLENIDGTSTNLRITPNINTKSTNNIITSLNNEYNKNKYSSQNLNKFSQDNNIVPNTPNDNTVNTSIKINNTKNTQSQRERLATKMSNKNFVKSNTIINNISSTQDDFISIAIENNNNGQNEKELSSNLVPSNKQSKNNITSKLTETRKRNISSNKRYENEEKENKSKSPVGSNKNYVLKPKVKKLLTENMNSSTNNISKNININNNNLYPKNKSLISTCFNNNESTNNYMTELNNESNKMSNKASKKLIGNNYINNTSQTSRNKKNTYSGDINSASTNTINSSRNKLVCNNNGSKNEEFCNFNFLNTSHQALPEFEITSFIRMISVLNEIGKNSIKETDNRHISEDMSKLLFNLVDCAKSEPVEIDNAKNTKYDLRQLSKIQRNWRSFKIMKKLQMTKKEQNCIDKQLKNSLLDSLYSNENFNQILSLMNTSLLLFNSMIKNNQNFNSTLNDYLLLSNEDNISEKVQSQVRRNFLTRCLKKNSINSANMKTNIGNVLTENDKSDFAINSKILCNAMAISNDIRSVYHEKRFSNKISKLSKSYDIQAKTNNSNFRNLIYLNSSYAAKKKEKSFSSINEDKELKNNFENNYFIVSTKSVNVSRSDNKGTS